MELRSSTLGGFSAVGGRVVSSFSRPMSASLLAEPLRASSTSRTCCFCSALSISAIRCLLSSSSSTSSSSSPGKVSEAPSFSMSCGSTNGPAKSSSWPLLPAPGFEVIGVVECSSSLPARVESMFLRLQGWNHGGVGARSCVQRRSY